MGTPLGIDQNRLTIQELMGVAVAKRDELSVFIAILTQLIKEAEDTKTEGR
jgi:hypothetical protein